MEAALEPIERSQRVRHVKPSATLAITATANALKAQGKSIISLSAGEPDFDTPEHIKQAAISAINEGFTRYTAVDGIPELKQAIIDKLAKDNQLNYSADQVAVNCGGKQSFFNLAQALLNPGDEVIIPAPYWVSYPDMVYLAEAKPVIVHTEAKDRFKLQAQALKRAITDRTRLVVLNSPSNPTGIAYSHDDLKALADVLLEHQNIAVVSDDMYEHILWAERPFRNIVNVCPELYDRTFVLNGVSKAYAMTGWRIGYSAGPAHIMKAMKVIQSQSTSNPCSVSQKAALAALTGPQDCVRAMTEVFKRRHDFIVDRLNRLEGVHCLPADGAFYVFPNVMQLIGRLPDVDDDIALAQMFLEKAEVAVVPGSAFGAPGFIRLSFANSDEALEKALNQIEHCIR